MDGAGPERPPHAEMLAWYRELIALRRAHANLRDPSPASTFTTIADGVITIDRGSHTLIANLSETPLDLRDADVVLTSSLVTGTLPVNTCAILRRGS